MFIPMIDQDPRHPLLRRMGFQIKDLQTRFGVDLEILQSALLIIEVHGHLAIRINVTPAEVRELLALVEYGAWFSHVYQLSHLHVPGQSWRSRYLELWCHEKATIADFEGSNDDRAVHVRMSWM
ncbi:hypothetical protein J6590_023162 [Homalodisca vitripennis]|nr:hypothetical protein J6590_023162 [Homalodisca vitripennis]